MPRLNKLRRRGAALQLRNDVSAGDLNAAAAAR